MIQIDASLRNKIANMSLVCSVFVVCIHMLGVHGAGSHIYDKWFMHFFTTAAVPFFFVVSGFFFANHIDEKGWWINALRKRFWSIVVPFFVLNLLYFPVKYGIHYFAYRYFGADHSQSIMELNLRNFLISISPLPIDGGPVDGPLWYLRALIYLVFCSPLYVWIIKRSRMCAIFFLFVVLYFWDLQATRSVPWSATIAKELNLRCLFYFSVGISLRVWGRVLGRTQFGIMSMVVAVGMHAIHLADCCPSRDVSFMLDLLQTLAIIFGMWCFMPDRQWPTWLAKNSFAIYVLHFPIIYVGDAFFKAVKLISDATTVMGTVVRVVLYVAVACLMANGMRKYMPRFAALVFGGR